MFTAYDHDFLQLGQVRYTAGLLLIEGEITSPWGPEHIDGLTAHHLAQVIEQKPEILLIGTGRKTVFPDGALLAKLRQAHIGVECMDSRAAARTYNILVAEGRVVAAAMLLPGA